MQINGRELKITPAGFGDALALEKAIGRALKGTKLELPDKVTTDMSPTQLGDIIGAVLGVATSNRVEDCLFVCAEKALYGGEKVDRDFFEKIENRELYYPIMVEIIKVNVGPFFKGIASKLGGLGAILTAAQK